MPDLHGWITQQIDKTEAVARDAGGKAWHWEHGYGDLCNDPTCPYGELATDDTSLMEVHGLDIKEPRQGAAHIALHDPAAVLRRCEADRRILARHRLNPDAYWAEAAMCEGCGTEGEMGYPRTENLNNCPELLDLGYAHGLTPEILAALDRPTEGERPEPSKPSGPSLVPNVLVEAYSRAITEMILNAQPVESRPEVKALKILGPELKKIPSYVPIAEEAPDA
jgi:hypothetical protein